VSPPVSGRSHTRILLVSDDATVADACSRALRLEGFEVWTALSAEDGLKYAATHLPHAVVIDVRAPLTSSLALADRVRGLSSLAAVPVGVVSPDRRPRTPDIDLGQRRGVQVRYKPLWLAELVDFARSLAGSS
jgi:two-component system response regulator PrrA